VLVVLKCWTEPTPSPVVLVLPATFREFQLAVFKHRGNSHSKLYWFQTAELNSNARIAIKDEVSYRQYVMVCGAASAIDACVLIVWAFTVGKGVSPDADPVSSHTAVTTSTQQVARCVRRIDFDRDVEQQASMRPLRVGGGGMLAIGDGTHAASEADDTSACVGGGGYLAIGDDAESPHAASEADDTSACVGGGGYVAVGDAEISYAVSEGVGSGGCSATSSGRPTALQKYFREGVHFLYPDSDCLLCGHKPSGISPLEAAHIVPVKQNPWYSSAWGTMGLYSNLNGLLLCATCHILFDKHLWFVHPMTRKVVVMDALTHHADLGSQYRKYAGKHIHLVEGGLAGVRNCLLSLHRQSCCVFVVFPFVMGRLN
jgi:hypothetical protein